MSAQTFFGPALGIGAMFFAGFFILDLLVKRGTTKSFDIGGIKGLRVAGTGVPKIGARWAPVMRGLTQLGGPVVRYAIAVPACAWLAWQGNAPRALWAALTMASGWLVDGIAKKIFKRTRPDLVPRLAAAGGPSFPSGHTLNSALVYCVLAIAFAPLIGPGATTAALIAAVALSACVGFSRVWLGVHWPSDVIAGWCLGTGWWLAAFASSTRLLGS
jgi:undecaprenyl-diphosphatase